MKYYLLCLSTRTQTPALSRRHGWTATWGLRLNGDKHPRKESRIWGTTRPEVSVPPLLPPARGHPKTCQCHLAGTGRLERRLVASRKNRGQSSAFFSSFLSCHSPQAIAQWHRGQAHTSNMEDEDLLLWAKEPWVMNIERCGSFQSIFLS